MSRPRGNRLHLPLHRIAMPAILPTKPSSSLPDSEVAAQPSQEHSIDIAYSTLLAMSPLEPSRSLEEFVLLNKPTPEPSSDIQELDDHGLGDLLLYSDAISKLAEVQVEGQQRGKVLFPLILTAIVVIFTAGPGTALLLWLVTHNDRQVMDTLSSQRAFIADEATIEDGSQARLIGLTISSVAVRVVFACSLMTLRTLNLYQSSLITITIPFMMTLYAYRIAAAWIAASRGVQSPARSLPTSLQ